MRALVADLLEPDPSRRPTSDAIVARLTSADDGGGDDGGARGGDAGARARKPSLPHQASAQAVAASLEASERFEPPKKEPMREAPQPQARKARRGSTFQLPWGK